MSDSSSSTPPPAKKIAAVLVPVPPPEVRSPSLSPRPTTENLDERNVEIDFSTNEVDDTIDFDEDVSFDFDEDVSFDFLPLLNEGLFGDPGGGPGDHFLVRDRSAVNGGDSSELGGAVAFQDDVGSPLPAWPLPTTEVSGVRHPPCSCRTTWRMSSDAGAGRSASSEGRSSTDPSTGTGSTKDRSSGAPRSTDPSTSPSRSDPNDLLTGNSACGISRKDLSTDPSSEFCEKCHNPNAGPRTFPMPRPRNNIVISDPCLGLKEDHSPLLAMAPPLAMANRLRSAIHVGTSREPELTFRSTGNIESVKRTLARYKRLRHHHHARYKASEEKIIRLETIMELRERKSAGKGAATVRSGTTGDSSVTVSQRTTMALNVPDGSPVSSRATALNGPDGTPLLPGGGSTGGERTTTPSSSSWRIGNLLQAAKEKLDRAFEKKDSDPEWRKRAMTLNMWEWESLRERPFEGPGRLTYGTHDSRRNTEQLLGEDIDETVEVVLGEDGADSAGEEGLLATNILSSTQRRSRSAGCTISRRRTTFDGRRAGEHPVHWENGRRTISTVKSGTTVAKKRNTEKNSAYSRLFAALSLLVAVVVGSAIGFFAYMENQSRGGGGVFGGASPSTVDTTPGGASPSTVGTTPGELPAGGGESAPPSTTPAGGGGPPGGGTPVPSVPSVSPPGGGKAAGGTSVPSPGGDTRQNPLFPTTAVPGGGTSRTTAGEPRTTKIPPRVYSPQEQFPAGTSGVHPISPLVGGAPHDSSAPPSNGHFPGTSDQRALFPRHYYDSEGTRRTSTQMTGRGRGSAGQGSDAVDFPWDVDASGRSIIRSSSGRGPDRSSGKLASNASPSEEGPTPARSGETATTALPTLPARSRAATELSGNLHPDVPFVRLEGVGAVHSAGRAPAAALVRQRSEPLRPPLDSRSVEDEDVDPSSPSPGLGTPTVNGLGFEVGWHPPFVLEPSVTTLSPDLFGGNHSPKTPPYWPLSRPPTEKCPAACISPNVQSGAVWNQGIPLVDGVCTEFASRKYQVRVTVRGFVGDHFREVWWEQLYTSYYV